MGSLSSRKEPIHSVWESARLLISGDPAPHPLAIITAYGTAQSDPLMLVCGFLGSVADWQAYEEAWALLLEGVGIGFPETFEVVVEGLRGLPLNRRFNVFRDMAELLRVHGLFGRGAFVRASDFEAYTDDPADPWRSKGEICAIACLDQMSDLCARHFPRRSLTIAFKSEDQEVNFLRLYEHLSSQPLWAGQATPHMNNLMFYAKAKSAATRAVDILAYMIYVSCLNMARALRVSNVLSQDPETSPIRIIEIDDEAIVGSAAWMRRSPSRR